MAFSADSLRPFLPPVSDHLESVWWIGFSGGLDSSVLLHALSQLQLPVKLQAVHINHCISPNANYWQEHCAAVCNKLAIPHAAHLVQVKNQGRGIEDAAREMRYQVFSGLLRAGDYLLTGHHADDQAETLLLRLMRGAGPRGLAAMAAQRSLGQGRLYRPLLTFSRAELEAYATQHQLTWIDDESNASDDYDRNYLRNQVMPLLRARWPSMLRKWQQTAELCAANEALIEEIAQEDLQRVDEHKERIGWSISLTNFLSLTEPRQKNLLRYWLVLRGYAVPEQQHWQQIYQQLSSRRDDAQIDIRWEKVSLRVYQQRLYCLPQKFPAGKLLMEPSTSMDLPRLKPTLPNIQIRYREGGERCKPAGRAHSQTLKKLLQDYRLEPWLRDQVPLVYSDEQLVAVGDLWVCEGYAAEPEEEGLLLVWRFIAED